MIARDEVNRRFTEGRVFCYLPPQPFPHSLREDSAPPTDVPYTRIPISRERIESIFADVRSRHGSWIVGGFISDILHAQLCSWLQCNVLYVDGVVLSASSVLPVWAAAVRCNREGRYMFDLRTLQELDK